MNASTPKREYAWEYPPGTAHYSQIRESVVDLLPLIQTKAGCPLLMLVWAHSGGLVFDDARKPPEWTDPVSVETLSKDCYATPEEIWEAIEQLVDQGILERTEDDRYRVCLENFQSLRVGSFFLDRAHRDQEGGRA